MMNLAALKNVAARIFGHFLEPGMTHEEDPSATVYKSSIYCAFANGGDCDRTFQLSNLDYQIGLFFKKKGTQKTRSIQF